MDSLLTLYITLVCVSGVFNVFLSVYAFSKRSEIPGAGIFILYTAALSIYCFGYAFGLASTTLTEVKIWTTVEYIGMPFSAALGLMLVLNYLGRNVSPKTAAAMFIIPSITLAMVATNDYHHLFYKAMYLREGMPASLVKLEIGEWYIVHGIYTFSCLLAAVVLLIGRWRQTSKTYRLQLVTLICGQFVPMTAAFLYLLGAAPGGLDPVPIVMCITSALYIWAMVSARMLTVVPIAKETIFESMGEGVIVLDPAERLIEFNRAAAIMIPSLRHSRIGSTLDEVWVSLTGSPFPVARHPDGMQGELAWMAGGEERCYQVRVSVVRHRNGGLAGSLLLLIDVTELKRLQRHLEHMAFYDGLTQIYNRTQFIHRSREMLKESLAEGQPFSVVLFDIDHFKRVNDSFGHETGDRLIVHVVSLCKPMLSADMLFGRYGGEEFVLALPSFSWPEAAELAERLRAALEAEPLVTASGPIAVTSSFGAAQAEQTGDTLESLLRAADEALYVSKRGGRNRVSVHQPAKSKDS
ncbi:histidine kinase N-terminal 7TM domain-containing protein [Paenibacillus hodogayensis]|uniref:Histidine kinase N-terminal 7TM domain-containing protein n=1 Tax=Paenibacillus hodogayensis TaxID=279208 RepID=A0ABV5VRV1_9BACL